MNNGVIYVIQDNLYSNLCGPLYECPMGHYKMISRYMIHYLFPLLITLLFLYPNSSFAHPGRLDPSGCHYNRNRGGYHCEKGALAGRSFNSKVDARIALRNLQEKEKYWEVVSIIDGETIILEGNERVRLIGIDTLAANPPPKPVEYIGMEATTYTKKMLEGNRVRLEYDQEKKDKYGGTLAYVYLEDDTLLNAEIIRQGYGYAYTRFPFKYMEEFRGHEREARENKRGLWKEKQLLPDKPEQRETVSAQELIMSDAYTLEALIYILERKGILTKKEVMEKINALRKEKVRSSEDD